MGRVLNEGMGLVLEATIDVEVFELVDSVGIFNEFVEGRVSDFCMHGQALVYEILLVFAMLTCPLSTGGLVLDVRVSGVIWGQEEARRQACFPERVTLKGNSLLVLGIKGELWAYLLWIHFN